jgi:hypothetical protein
MAIRVTGLNVEIRPGVFVARVTLPMDLIRLIVM